MFIQISSFWCLKFQVLTPTKVENIIWAQKRMMNQFMFLSFRTWNFSAQRELCNHVIQSFSLSSLPLPLPLPLLPFPFSSCSFLMEEETEVQRAWMICSRLQSKLVATFGAALKNTERRQNCNLTIWSKIPTIHSLFLRYTSILAGPLHERTPE